MKAKDKFLGKVILSKQITVEEIKRSGKTIELQNEITEAIERFLQNIKTLIEYD